MSTGAPSLLYTVVLGAVWAPGAHGTGFLLAAIGLGALAVAATTVLVFAVEQQRLRFVWTPLLGVLLALARPEGLLVDVGLVLGMLWVIGAATRVGLARTTAAALAVFAALPLLVGLVQVVLYGVLTGSGQANGILALRTGPLQTFLGPYPDDWSYGYWASQ